MSKEVIIIILEIIIIIVSLVCFVPKDKILEAHVAYLFKSTVTWIVGLIVAEYRLIEYPFRLFSYANKSSFLFLYCLNYYRGY